MLSWNLDSTEAAPPRRIAPHRTVLLGLLATAIALLGASSAQAATIFTGDQTTVLVTSYFSLTDAGIDVAPLGDAVIGNDIVDDQDRGEPRKLAAFPITGGGINTLTGDVVIEHDDSGLQLSTDDPPAIVSLEDFEILLDGAAQDGVLGTLFAQVSVNGGQATPNVPIFEITQCGLGASPACVDSDASIILNGLRLGLTGAAASLLNEVFLTDAFSEGGQVGIARVDVRVVPEPGTLLLTSLGLVGLAWSGRSRRRG